MTTPAYVTCPKCNGAKTINGFSHVANGVCFLCSGNGTILAGPQNVTQGTPAPVKPSRTVTLPSFGAVVIERDSVGLVARFPDTDDRPGTGPTAWFRVVAGKVVGLVTSDGIRRALRPAVERELQAAVRVS